MYFSGVLFLLILSRIFCFNIDTNNVIVYKDPQKGQNYFGYSVVLYPGDDKEFGWIKIGAPKGRDPEIQVSRPGVVYNCPYMGTCSPLHITPHPADIVLNNSWTGGTMDISYTLGKLMICGFRTKYRPASRSHHFLTGSCYLSSLNGNFKEITGLRPDDMIKRINKVAAFSYAQAEIGFSIHFPENESTVILGAPGAENWQGKAIKVDPLVGIINTSSDTTLGDELIGDYNGYTVNSGRFFGPQKLYYVSSSPKGHNYRGEVKVFDFNKDGVPRKVTSLVGEQFGAYFGASIAVGDLNSDGIDDLIIGAPYYTLNSYNEGAVYVFLGSKSEEDQPAAQLSLHGVQPNSQYGSTIMFLGDLDHDGFGDVAVAAPYEEDFSGVLYIYKGNRRAINPVPSQKIIGKHISPKIRGFGISISRPADMDENGYQDIIVGAHKSGNAVLLRTKPIVVVDYEVKSITQEKSLGFIELITNICFWYTHYEGESINLKIMVLGSENLGDVIRKKYNEWNETITINLNETICRNATVNILRNSSSNQATVDISYKFIASQNKKTVTYISDIYINGTDAFCKNCSVLDTYRSKKRTFHRVNIVVDPVEEKNQTHQPKFKINARFVGLERGKSNTFVVGSKNQINLYATVESDVEKNVFLGLQIILPVTTSVKELPPPCFDLVDLVHYLIVCSLEERNINLCIDMEGVNKDSFQSELHFKLKVLNMDRIRFDDNLAQTALTLALEREANVTILGQAFQEVWSTESTNNRKEFNQIYWVDKTGYSPLEKVRVRISVPHSIKTSSGKIRFLKIYRPDTAFKAQEVICTSSFTYATESKAPGINNLEDESIDDITDEVKQYSRDETLDRDFIRRRRMVNVVKNEDDDVTVDTFFNEEKVDVIPDRTYFINCSSEDVICSDIECTVGPFDSEKVLATIQIRMILDISAIAGILEEKDYILYSTRGIATVEIPDKFHHRGKRQASFEVSSVFINEGKKSVIVLVVIIAAIAGIILLILIVYGLTKVGFFKRSRNVEIKYSRWIKIATEDFIVAESTPEPILRYIKSSNDRSIRN